MERSLGQMAKQSSEIFEVESTDVPCDRWEEKAENTFFFCASLIPNTVVCVCRTEPVHSVLRNVKRKGEKVGSINENTKPKEE